MPASSSENRFFFGGVTPYALNAVVAAYAKRVFDEDLQELSKWFGDEDNALDRLCSQLETASVTGIATTSADALRLRSRVFGNNAMPKRKSTPFWRFAYDASQDFVLRILMVSGMASLLLGLVFGERKNIEWIDGAAIFLAVIIVVLTTAGNDYLKERQFSALCGKNLKFCTVIRDGKQQRLLADDLLVGDVLCIEAGDELPADCLVLHGQELLVDESSMTGESRCAKKASWSEAQTEARRLKGGGSKSSSAANHCDLPSPVTMSGCTIINGSAKLLVIAVGRQSQAGQLMQKLVTDTEPTSLQNKLNHLAKSIGAVGLLAALLSLAVYLTQFWVMYAMHEEFRESLSASNIISRHVQFLVEAITILVVAVPEGLPLAVTLSLAFSVARMLQDQNYVRRLAACETMGEASEICSDKTGTLTRNEMTVELVWDGTRVWEGDDERMLLKRFAPKKYLDICAESIALNSTAYFQPVGRVDHENQPEANGRCREKRGLGSPTECALVAFIDVFGYDYEKLRRELGLDTQIVHRIPFSSSRKLMTTVAQHPSAPSLYRVYVKGAAEVVFQLCEYRVDEKGSTQRMEASYKAFVTHTIIPDMAGRGLRTVCVAYRDLDPSKEPHWKSVVTEQKNEVHLNSTEATTHNDDDSTDETDATSRASYHVMEVDLHCLMIVGMRDPVRSEVPAAVRQCQSAGIRVRMITGDNLETAKQIAEECHIHHPKYGGIALTGAEFYDQIGGVVCARCRTQLCDCPLNALEAEQSATSTTQENGDDQVLSRGSSRSDTSDVALLVQNSKSEQPEPSALTLELGQSNARVSCVMANSGGDRENWENQQRFCVDRLEPFGGGSTKSERSEEKQASCHGVRYRGKRSPCAREIRIRENENDQENLRREIRKDIVGNLDAFRSIALHLDIIARAQPRDKYALVLGLKSLGAVVAVTGDGANDAPALKKADVGFAMGVSGKEIAKQTADIILLDDNFDSIVKAVKWGRNIYDNIRRFLQFQLTVNVSAVTTAFLGCFVLGESPLTAVQLLWVNLIMDTFASLALATEPPTDQYMNQPPFSRHANLVSKAMLCHILSQASYQIIIMVLLIFTGECWIPEHSSQLYARYEGRNGFSQFSTTCGGGHTVTAGRRFRPFSQEEVYKREWALEVGPSRHYTIVFNTFVILQIVNLISAKKARTFQALWQGKRFSSLWIVILGIIIMGQYILVQFGGHALSSHLEGLTWDQWLLCISFGLGGLVVEAILTRLVAYDRSFREQQQQQQERTPKRYLTRSWMAAVRKGSSADEHNPFGEKPCFRRNRIMAMQPLVRHVVKALRCTKRRNSTHRYRCGLASLEDHHSAAVTRSMESLRQPLVDHNLEWTSDDQGNATRRPLCFDARSCYSAPTLEVLSPLSQDA